MGVLDVFGIFRRNSELGQMYDLDLIEEASRKTALKRMAVETVIGMISRTVIQSEFRIKKDEEYIKDEMYYKFNVKPNVNQSASVFWGQVITKLIYNGECLIIKTDTDDLLVAEDYTRTEYALFGDDFSNVMVKGYEYQRTFKREEVVFFEYGNEKLSKLVDSLFCDYGELLGRIIEFQMRKNQVRATVDVETVVKKNEDGSNPLQNFINKAYNAIRNSAVAIIPQQKGFTYKEHSANQMAGQSVDEINKVTDGFLSQVASAVGLPMPLLRGDLADVEKITRNYMMFCIDPIIKIIKDELNGQFVNKKAYLKGDAIVVRRAKYRDIFDIATAIDKLISSGGFNGNEMRDEAGYEQTDEEIHQKYFITKNYQESASALEGGEDK